ncbi:MAG: hypothetical protein J6K92_02845 [Oscillospiraceae bacterium]|nr:hypothetical protein [Oscillospiraceae bacterium]
MKITYTSENKIYRIDGGNKTEIPCGRIIKYKETLESIRRRTEWKTTGTGARFTGAARPDMGDPVVLARITGLCENKGQLIYGVRLDESCSLYSRSFDRTDENEGLILSGNNFHFGSFDCLDGKMAVSIGSNSTELHIAVMEPPSSAYDELTDGDSSEENPYWSRCHKNRIYFSAAGNGRNEYGAVAAVSPRSGAYIDIDRGEIVEFLSDPKTDHLRIKDDKFGNIFYIRQPYGGEHEKEGFKFSDILFFPFRVLKGFFGWLNFMCTMWGGESLKSGSDGLPSYDKVKRRSERDIIIDGNIINAERLAKEEDEKDSTSPLMPLSRVLVKREADGSETVIKKGVLDYALCSDGKIIISDGRRLILLDGDKETVITKARLAMNIVPEEDIG